MDCSAPGAGVRESFGLLSAEFHVERKESEGRRWDRAPSTVGSIFGCAPRREVDRRARGGMICGPET